METIEATEIGIINTNCRCFIVVNAHSAEAFAKEEVELVSHRFVQFVRYLGFVARSSCNLAILNFTGSFRISSKDAANLIRLSTIRKTRDTKTPFLSIGFLPERMTSVIFTSTPEVER
jgi:hypothetical protein